MNRFTNSIRLALSAQDWYGALFTALALPDICAKLETPSEGSKARSIRWFKEWLEPLYTIKIGPFRQLHVFLGGNDFYALRCALLHEGSADINEQNAQEILEKFHFITPPHNGIIHLNQFDNTLQIQVDIFCNDIAEAADSWARSVVNNESIQERMKLLLIIHDGSRGISF